MEGESFSISTNTALQSLDNVESSKQEKKKNQRIKHTQIN